MICAPWLKRNRSLTPNLTVPQTRAPQRHTHISVVSLPTASPVVLLATPRRAGVRTCIPNISWQEFVAKLVRLRSLVYPHWTGQGVIRAECCSRRGGRPAASTWLAEEFGYVQADGTRGTADWKS